SKAVGRDVDARHFFGTRSQFGKRLLQAIERGVDRVAAGVQPKIVTGDLPDGPEFIKHAAGLELAADQIAQRLLDRIELCGKTGKGQFWRERGGKSAHA